MILHKINSAISVFFGALFSLLRPIRRTTAPTPTPARLPHFEPVLVASTPRKKNCLGIFAFRAGPTTCFCTMRLNQVCFPSGSPPPIKAWEVLWSLHPPIVVAESAEECADRANLFLAAAGRN